ncbi:hypothetical protein D3C78_958980 [compost metagenome]
MHQPYFTLDLPVLGAHHRFHPGNGLLHVGDFQVGRRAEVGALADLIAGARELGRVAGEQAVELALEADAGIFGDGFFRVLKAHHRGEIVGVRLAAGGHAQQWQGIEFLCLDADVGHFAFDIGGQLAAAAADQFVPGQGQFSQVLRCGEQRREVGRIATGVLAELIETGAQFPLGLQQQGLRITCQFAGGQQVGLAEFFKGRQAGAQRLGQGRWQFAEFFLQAVDALGGTAQAQRIAAAQVILNAAGDVILKLLRQAQVALH